MKAMPVHAAESQPVTILAGAEQLTFEDVQILKALKDSTSRL